MQQSVPVTLSITIDSVLNVTGNAIPHGVVGQVYPPTAVATVSGGLAPYTYMITSGVLPSGMSLDSNSGVLSGTPTSAGTSSNIVVTIRDSGTP